MCSVCRHVPSGGLAATSPDAVPMMQDLFSLFAKWKKLPHQRCIQKTAYTFPALPCSAGLAANS